ncbi:MAG: esterase-like activity of phytase family protein [Thermoanaerobaculia bacterium]
MRPAILAFLPALLALPAAGAPPAPAPLTGLSLVGRAVLPRDYEFEGTRVGGLSGLTWDAKSGSFWAISDDRGQFGPSRAYRLRIELPSGPATPTPAPKVTIEGMLPLSDANGKPYTPSLIDTEGIAIVPGGFLVSTEPIVRKEVQAIIGEYGPDGRLRREIPLPPACHTEGEHGGRDNLGFEGLATSGDGRFLFAGLENALAQDGPVADVGVPSPSRILRYDLGKGGRPAEFVYMVDGVSPAPARAETYRVNGLSDLYPLDADRLLVLERQFIEGVGNAARLFEVSLEGASDVSGLDSIKGADFVPAKKSLLVDLVDVGVPLENFEGMTFGPPLPDGRSTLVLVSDDNFNPAQEATTFLVFAVDRSPMTVARVQGPGHRSPLEGSWVVGVKGIVTAIDRDARNTGFFLESSRPDGDPATSEGIFVLYAGAATLTPGQAVSVSGRVEEVAQAKGLSVTRLRGGTVAPVEGEPPLPPPVKLFTERRVPPAVDDDGLTRFEPASDAIDFWESLEGMRVEVPGGTAVGPSSSRGDFVLRPDGAPPVPRTLAGGVLLTEKGPSLDRVLLGRRLCGSLPVVDVGARMRGPFTGIVDYAFGNYRVWPLAPLSVESDGRGCDAKASLRGDRRHLTIAAFNVENLSVAGPAERFARLGERIVSRLGSPDVLSLEEVQDDSGAAGKGDGVVTSRKTLDALVAGIAGAGGPRYEAAWIDPVEGKEGGQPGGNIRVALLLNPARVTLVKRGEAGSLDATEPEGLRKELHLTLSPGRVAPRSTAFTPSEGEGVRRTLAAELRFDGKTLFVLANHWSSKTDDDRAFGATQPPRTPTASRRLAQAREIRAFVERLLAADPEARVVAVGDLNDFEFSEPVRTFAAPPLEDLLMRVPAGSRYTFNFDGASQVLDHAVVSPALARDAAVEVVHFNSDCSDEKRTSDHDPVLVRLRPR